MVFDFMEKYNGEYYKEVKNLFKKQKAIECSMDDFRARAENAKLVIWTGELIPASNIILVSASGVDFVSKELDVRCWEDKNTDILARSVNHSSLVLNMNGNSLTLDALSFENDWFFFVPEINWSRIYSEVFLLFVECEIPKIFVQMILDKFLKIFSKTDQK